MSKLTYAVPALQVTVKEQQVPWFGEVTPSAAGVGVIFTSRLLPKAVMDTVFTVAACLHISTYVERTAAPCEKLTLLSSNAPLGNPTNEV